MAAISERGAPIATLSTSTSGAKQTDGTVFDAHEIARSPIHADLTPLKPTQSRPPSGGPPRTPPPKH